MRDTWKPLRDESSLIPPRISASSVFSAAILRHPFRFGRNMREEETDTLALTARRFPYIADDGPRERHPHHLMEVAQRAYYEG